MNAYKQLEKRFERLSKIEEAIGVLGWDRATMMPEGGAAGRAEQIATLSVLAHEGLTDPALADLLEQAADIELSEWQQANLGEMRRDWVHANALPSDLVEATSRAVSECETVWMQARAEDDFAKLAPYLKRQIDLIREGAVAKGEALGCSAYDALLDQFDPGMSAATIDPIFEELVAFLPGFIDEVLAHQASAPAPIQPQGPFPEAAQRELSHSLMKTLGFDFNHGRLDTSAHAFCGGTTDDVRLTTNYDEQDFARSIMGTIHETGHALYSMGLPTEWRYQPVGRARGMSIHESQSLLMEMQVCRSRDFLEYAAPMMREAFAPGSDSAEWSVENIFALSTRVERSLIRIDADEVTYPAHVILRYQLERKLIGGELSVEDLPQAWNTGMKELVGITPDSDRDGCMQDVHWMSGAFGYFPTYTLGAMTAAQLYAAAREQDPTIVPGVKTGDFAPLRTWLRDNIHAKASSKSTVELVKEATGKALDVEVFKAHLRQRYLPSK
ncbi:carboxypeptidase M32 [Bradymonas sediminis]|uniref:Metal-dependent carboxypeptidase n=1 Tax=Bradymonas sediminis TaxID=1548548 RepID=A0A2Z4FJA0_9DELT|nr:carboxypeptidase M32 [Bradymonas sediminis]AWV88766.1 carboxypeptidase M32 [Bradymonas sediminis]TDP61764.1 carboxypeptidase Taq [Bradymonas sediminis]